MMPTFRQVAQQIAAFAKARSGADLDVERDVLPHLNDLYWSARSHGMPPIEHMEPAPIPDIPYVAEFGRIVSLDDGSVHLCIGESPTRWERVVAPNCCASADVVVT